MKNKRPSENSGRKEEGDEEKEKKEEKNELADSMYVHQLLIYGNNTPLLPGLKCTVNF
jgi:hypothetical protein